MAQYLEGNWPDKFLNYSVLLRENIANLNATRVSVLFLDDRFLCKVWDNIKRLFDPLWIAIYALVGEIVILIIIFYMFHTAYTQALFHK